MAQATSNPKIEELRFRLKTDPKSRLFYQLAEELRKGGHFGESEQVLRSGLAVYPAYLAAWVSLGRVLRETKNDNGAIEALNKAMQLDPGNVVAARLLGDAHRNLGDNVEAIKKYKLVHALLPGDEDLKATIEALDREINPPAVVEAPPAVEEPAFAPPMEDSPFDRTVPPFDESSAIETGDADPMLATHEESPFEEPVAEAATMASFEVEQPAGMHIEVAPLAAEVPTPLVEEEVFEPAASAPEPAHAEDLTNTLTMADLYARQGLTNDARHIYENILARDPGNDEVRGKLDAITPRVNPKIERLERWLTRVSRKEVGRV